MNIKKMLKRSVFQDIFIVVNLSPCFFVQPHPLSPPLLARLTAGEGDKKKEGLTPLLNAPYKNPP